MSLDRNVKNYVTITLYQSKICRNPENYLPYTLSIKYNNQSPLETEKIIKSSMIFHEETFHFNISSTSKQNMNPIITINAYSRTMFVIKNYFAKVIIPFNISNNHNQKQWYFLKDNNEEIVLKILLSIDSTLSLHQNNSMNLINKSYRIESAHNLLNKKNLNLSLNLNSYSPTQRQSANKSMVNLNTFSMLKNLTSQNQLVSIAENDSSSNITISNIDSDSNYSDCNEDHQFSNSIDFNNISITYINNAISDKADQILEKQKNFDKKFYEYKERDSSIGRKKNILNKENEKLQVNIKKIEKNKKIYETKSLNLNENFIKFEKELFKNELKEEINIFNQKMFYNINSLFIRNTSDMILNDFNRNLVLEKDLKRISKNSNNHPNISINVDFIDEPIMNSKKLKYEYLTSKHLNSTNFTSVYSSESLINKHYSPSTNNIYELRIKNKNKNSLDLDIALNKNTKRTSSKKEVELDNIKLVRIKSSSSKSNLLNNNNNGRRQILRPSIKRPSLNSLSKSNVNIVPTTSKIKKKIFEPYFIPHNFNQGKNMNFINNINSNKSKTNPKNSKK